MGEGGGREGTDYAAPPYFERFYFTENTLKSSTSQTRPHPRIPDSPRLRSFNNANKKAEANHQAKSVAGLDIKHLQMGLTNMSTSTDVLWWIATTPENLLTAKRTLEELERIKKDREGMVVGPDMSSGGWADEDTETSRVRRIREEEERKAIERMAGGNNLLKTEKIEGLDEGVVGIEWVRKTLEGKVRRNNDAHTRKP